MCWKEKYKSRRWKREKKKSSFNSYVIRISADPTITLQSSPLGPWSKEYYFDSNGRHPRIQDHLSRTSILYNSALASDYTIFCVCSSKSSCFWTCTEVHQNAICQILAPFYSSSNKKAVRLSFLGCIIINSITLKNSDHNLYPPGEREQCFHKTRKIHATD